MELLYRPDILEMFNIIQEILQDTTLNKEEDQN